MQKRDRTYPNGCIFEALNELSKCSVAVYSRVLAWEQVYVTRGAAKFKKAATDQRAIRYNPGA